MAGKMQISTDEITQTVAKALDEYGDAAAVALKVAGRKTVRETAKEVNASAASKIHGRRGKYEKSWKGKYIEGRVSFEGYVYSSQPGLPHLLEEGHLITYLGGNKNKGPGKARAIPHIKEVDDKVPDLFMNNIEREVEKL